MPGHRSAIQPRLEVVDALRGLALLGLCLIHALEHWDLLVYPDTAPVWLQTLDRLAHGIVFFLFAGKAFAIFSFMFGLSFFIQIDRQASRGVDFRGRFLWRLVLLGLIGYLHGLLYCGDVLILFAVLGALLVPLDRLGSRTLLVLALLAALNPPYLYQFVLALGDNSIDPRPYEIWNLYGRAFELFGHGSLAEVIRFNAWSGQVMKWGWYLQEGRIWQILALFLVGLVAGRSRFFEDIERHRVQSLRLLLASVVGFAGLSGLRVALDSLPLSDNAAYLADKLTSSYANLCFTAVWISGFALLFLLPRWQRRLSGLAPLGRMSLTNYVAQSMVGVPFFYAFGLGMYHLLGPTLSLVFGIVLITLMIWASRIWLRHFHYGPLEWLWRAATFGTTDIPFTRRRV